MPQRMPPGKAAALKQASDHPQPNDAEDKLLAQFTSLERQLQELKRQTRQAQKLASMGTVAAVLAHECNNLMAPVVTSARDALDRDDKDAMVKALNRTLTQVGVMTVMADHILGLAANEAPSYGSVNVARLNEEALACLCRDLSKDGITLDCRIDPSITVHGDQGQLLQVLFNLLINARQAIEHRNGRIKIVAELVHDAERGDEQVSIRVSDNGSGIPPENQARIFDEFFSTKKRASGRGGMGLGLALCKEIIEEHRGTIAVESEVGKGTTFTITLPAA